MINLPSPAKSEMSSPPPSRLPKDHQRANLTPENCHRAPAGKKFRYVARECPAGVATEDPRNTYWFTMNFPLYSPIAPAAATNPGYAA